MNPRLSILIRISVTLICVAFATAFLRLAQLVPSAWIQFSGKFAPTRCQIRWYRVLGISSTRQRHKHIDERCNRGE